MEPLRSNKQIHQNDAFIEKLTRIVLENLHNEQFGVNELAKAVHNFIVNSPGPIVRKTCKDKSYGFLNHHVSDPS